MEFGKPKKLVLLLASLLFLVVLSSAAALYYFTVGAYGGVFRCDFPQVLFTDDSGNEVFGESSIVFSEGENRYRVKNREGQSVSLSLFSSGKLVTQVNLEPGEEKEITLTLPNVPTLVMQSQEENFAYVGDEEGLRAASSLMIEGGDLYFPQTIALGGVHFAAPFRLFGDFTVGEITFATELSGNIVLFPRKAGSVLPIVSAPAASFYTKNLTLPIGEERLDYYITAKSYNGKKLRADYFPVTTWEEFSALSDPARLPKLPDGGEVSFLGEFDLKNDVTLLGHYSLDFKKKISFGEHVLHLSSEGEGEFRVRTALGTAPSAEELIFSAPLSDLVWESEVLSVPAPGSIEKYSNIASYNGVALTLGGAGSAIPTLVLTELAHEEFVEEITFGVKGNLLVGTLPFLISEADLKEASFTLTCNGGECRLEGDLSSGVVVTVDQEGKERRFGIAAAREKESIPVVYLETEGGAEITSKSQYISATFALDGEETEVPSVKESHIRIRGRGNSTWKWEKKPYKIHFDEPTSLLGLPAAEEWALFSNYADKSLIRNRLAQVIASKLSFDYCPTQVCVDVFLNGEYLGIYTLGEHLEAGEGRVEIREDSSRMDCGFFLEAGGVVAGVDVKGMNYFHAGLVKFVLIKTPDYSLLTSEQFDFIKKYMQAADEAVKAKEGYEEYLDMETLVDWFLMIELSNNTDCSWRRSTYFTKNPGEKVKMGPVWDFDLAFGNFSKDVEGFDTWVSTSEDDYVGETWSTHLLQDPEFQALVKKRWLEVRDVLLEAAMEEIDASYELLSPSAKYNFRRWDILGKKVAFERHDTKNYPTFRSQMTYLKDFLENRFAWLDSQILAW